MATYTFKFPASSAGHAVTVRNAAGDSVNTGTAGSASALHGSVTYTAVLPAGSYTATAVKTNINAEARAVGYIDLEAAVVALQTGVADLVAEYVDPASGTFAADLIAALIAAGLMADEA